MTRGLKELSLLCGFAVAWLLTFTATLPAAQPPPRVDPVQVNKDVRAGTQNLERDFNSAIRELQRLTGEVDKLKTQAREARRKAEAAWKAAREAEEAASKCKTDRDKQRVQGLIADAKKKLKEAQDAKDKTETMESDLRKKIDDIGKAAEKRISDLQNALDAGFAAAKNAGIPDNSVAVGNLRDAETRLNQEVAKQRNIGTAEKNFNDQGTLSKVRTAPSEFEPKIREASVEIGPPSTLDEADQNIKDAENLLNNCPPKVGALVPQQSTDMFAFVNNQQEVLACIAPGQNPMEAANAIGMANHQLVAGGPGGTMIRGPGNPQTVNRLANERRITLCFPAENDVCIIMTPLTPFRSHDHEAHSHSGRGVHDHQPSDPPPDWGVTPLETVIRWQEKEP